MRREIYRMTAKRVLVIGYFGPIANCFLLAVIKHTGHEMIVEYVTPPEVLTAKTFSDLAKLNPHLLDHNLADFDIVVVLVCGPAGFPEDFIIPIGVVDELKEMI